MEWKRLKSREAAVLLTVLAFVTVLFLLRGHEKSFRDELFNRGYAEANIDNILFLNQSTVIFLSVDGDKLPIYVSKSQGEAIAKGETNLTSLRPSTHDLIKKILENQDLRVLGLSVNKLENDIFYGTLYLQKGEEIIKFDVRPSDGMAVVTRFEAPIYVNTELLYEEVEGVNRTKEIEL